jgi:hypothetical protein
LPTRLEDIVIIQRFIPATDFEVPTVGMIMMGLEGVAALDGGAT